DGEGVRQGGRGEFGGCVPGAGGEGVADRGAGVHGKAAERAQGNDREVARGASGSAICLAGAAGRLRADAPADDGGEGREREPALAGDARSAGGAGPGEAGGGDVADAG